MFKQTFCGNKQNTMEEDRYIRIGPSVNRAKGGKNSGNRHSHAKMGINHEGGQTLQMVKK